MLKRTIKSQGKVHKSLGLGTNFKVAKYDVFEGSTVQRGQVTGVENDSFRPQPQSNEFIVTFSDPYEFSHSKKPPG